MILVQMYNIFRLLLGVPDYSIVVSRMEENKNDVENDGYLNKLLFFSGECCLKKSQNVPRPSERPPVRGGKMSNDINTDVQYI